MNRTDPVIAQVEKIVPGGDALLRVDGTVVLMLNAVPGDVVELRLLEKRRGVLRAELVRVLKASDRRVTAPCPVASACGGCALQYISATDQASLKSLWVEQTFKSLIDNETEIMPLYCGASERRRVRWFVGDDGGERFLGFYAPASHDCVRHQQCMVLTPALNALRKCIEKNLDLTGIHSLQAVQLDDGIHIVLDLEPGFERCPDGIEINEMKTINALPLQWWWRDHQRITRPMIKPVQVFHDLLPAGNENIRLVVGADDFVQGQEQGNRELIRQIQLWAGSVKRIADLFCGIGNLSLPLAMATGAQIVGAELNVASVRAATANAKLLGISAQFEVANLFENFDLEAYTGADVLILDPPRRGAKRLCNQMARLMPKKIIMVSCDMAAGARDGVLLRQQGYRLKALRALDLFVYAGHIEAMSFWERQ